MNKCWCGSGLDYEVCHREFDKKINYYKKRGVMTPPRSMIKNKQQIEGIKKAAVVNNGLLDHIEKNIKIGMSTEDIDVLTREYLKEHNAHSADLNYEGYPKSICTSINDVVCHGIPSPNVILKDGDIISIDIDNHELNVLVSDQEMEARKAKWQPRTPQVTTGYLARYASLVTSADRGAVLQVK